MAYKNSQYISSHSVHILLRKNPYFVGFLSNSPFSHNILRLIKDLTTIFSYCQILTDCIFVDSFLPSVDKSTQARKACFGVLLRSRRLYYAQQYCAPRPWIALKTSSLGSLSFRSQGVWQNKEDECRNTGCISNEDDAVMPCYLAPKTLCVLVN